MSTVTLWLLAAQGCQRQSFVDPPSRSPPQHETGPADGGEDSSPSRAWDSAEEPQPQQPHPAPQL